jgi:tetratricopeptide (TPR) repeat protein
MNQIAYSQPSLDNAPGKGKTIFYIAMVIVLLAAIGGGGFFVKKHYRKILSEKNLNLPEDGRIALEAQLEALENQINNFPPEAKANDKDAVYVRLAEVKYRLGLYSQALSALENVSDNFQNNPAVLALYAGIYHDQGDIIKAKESARQTVDADNKNPQAWLVYIELSNKSEKSGLYSQALEKTGGSIGVVTAYAKFLEDSGNKQASIEQWQKAAEIFPAGKTTYDGEISRLQTSK